MAAGAYLTDVWNFMAVSGIVCWSITAAAFVFTVVFSKGISRGPSS